MPVPSAITDLSTTPASNSPAGSESPATTDDYFRSHAAFIAQLRAVIGGTADPSIPVSWPSDLDLITQAKNSGTTGGTSTAYTLTPAKAITSYSAGMTFWVRFHAASGASPTLMISGLASPPALVRQNASGAFVAIGAGEIPLNHASRVTLLSATQALVEELPPAADVSNSALQTDGLQVGRSGTASNNFHWRNLLDGLLRLSRGNAGSLGVGDNAADVMRVKADSSVEFPGGYTGSANDEKRRCTAWVNFNGTGTVAIRDSYNVSSITDNGTGNYTVNFATAMNNSNYSVSGSAKAAGGTHGADICQQDTDTMSTSAVQVRTIIHGSTTNAAADATVCSVVVLGGR